MMLLRLALFFASLSLVAGCRSESCGRFEIDEETDRCVCPDPFVFDADGRTCICVAPLILSGDETTCVMPDGGMPDGAVCVDGESRDCIAPEATGLCQEGTQTCVGGGFSDCEAADPTAELCDGLDNDCDGSIDGLAASAACEDLPQTRTSACTAGTCVIAECNSGFDDCNDDPSDGCEVELATAAAHCGTCDMACDGADLCLDGGCVSPPVHEWSVSLESASVELTNLATDADGNVFAVGEYISSLNIDGATRDGSGGRDGFLVSLDTDGRFRWMVTVNGDGFDSLDTVVAMDDGSACFVGRFEHPATFVDGVGDESSLTSVGSTTAMLGCVDSTGRRQFVERFGGTGISIFSDMAVDSGSNLYVTGSFGGRVDFGSVLVSRGAEDVVLASYQPDGTHRWSRSFGASMQDRGAAIAVRGSDLFVGGDFNQSIDFGGGELTAPARAGYLAQFDTDAHYIDSVAYGPAPRNGFITDLRARASGGLVVMGGFSGPTSLLGLDRSAVSRDGYVAFVDTGLTATSIVQLEDGAWWGTADLGASLVFAGSYSAGSIFEGAALPNRGNSDVLIAGFDADVTWYETYGGEGFDVGSAVVEHGSAHIVMGGRHAGASFGGPVLDPGPGVGGVIAKYRVR